MYKPLIAVLLILLALPSFSQSKNQPTSQQDKYVPDVVILVFSGVLPTDSVSCTYNNAGLTEKEARGDLQTLANATGSNFSDVRISTKALEPSNEKQTSSEFQAAGLVDYKQGGFKIEPFITTFKRFKNIEINYIVNNKFTFKGLRDYDDKYVNIKLSQPYRYRILIKNTEFANLNLPVTVANPVKAQAKTGGSGGARTLVALLVALAVGVVVYFGASRLSKTTK